MSKRMRAHLRGNVVGYVALFFAVSGTALATHPDGANTIDTGDIINGQVRTADIGTSQVRSIDVANDNTPYALTGTDVANNTLTGADVDESTLGFPGAIQAFAGSVGSAPVGPDWVFRGPTVSVTTTAAQPRITGAASAPLRISAGTVESADIALCFDADGPSGTPPEDFVQGFYESTQLDTVARIQAATASTSALLDFPGTYEVGFCVRKIAGNAVTGDFVNGWVMRTG